MRADVDLVAVRARGARDVHPALVIESDGDRVLDERLRRPERHLEPGRDLRRDRGAAGLRELHRRVGRVLDDRRGEGGIRSTTSARAGAATGLGVISGAGTAAVWQETIADMRPIALTRVSV